MRKQRIAIVDHVATVQEKAVLAVDQIPGNLLHPLPIRRRGDPGDLNPMRLEVDYEEHEVANEAAPGHDLDREEVRCSDRAPMSPQERLPSHGTTPGRIDSVLCKDSLDRVPADLVSEIHQRAANTRVSPTRILGCHPDDEALNFAIDS